MLVCICRSVCRKYECLQYDVERAEDNLAYKKSQKDLMVSLHWK